jgi:(2R)-sulfolactate sulfo-lyase subunit alpha
MSDADEQVCLLVHAEGDHVAVAVRDLRPGPASVAWLDSGRKAEVPITEDVPLGHKVALKDLAEGDQVIEYGVPIAVTRGDISEGALVHVHNIRSTKWQQSV